MNATEQSTRKGIDMQRKGKQGSMGKTHRLASDGPTAPLRHCPPVSVGPVRPSDCRLPAPAKWVEPEDITVTAVLLERALHAASRRMPLMPRSSGRPSGGRYGGGTMELNARELRVSPAPVELGPGSRIRVTLARDLSCA